MSLPNSKDKNLHGGLYVLYQIIAPFSLTLSDHFCNHTGLQINYLEILLYFSSTKPLKMIKVMSELKFALSYSTGSTVQGYLRLYTLIIHKQLIISWKRYKTEI